MSEKTLRPLPFNRRADALPKGSGLGVLERSLRAVLFDPDFRRPADRGRELAARADDLLEMHTLLETNKP